MAKHILYNASLTVNSVDLSDHVEKISYTEGVNSAGSGAAMSEAQDYDLAGTIKIGDITVTFFQDYATSKVYATIHPLVIARSTFNIVVKGDSGSAAATNPQFTIAVFVKNFSVFSGTRGDRHMSDVTFAPAGAQSISAP